MKRWIWWWTRTEELTKMVARHYFCHIVGWFPRSHLSSVRLTVTERDSHAVMFQFDVAAFTTHVVCKEKFKVETLRFPRLHWETYICALFSWHSSAILFVFICVPNCYPLCMPWHFHFSWLDVDSYSLPTTICAKTIVGRSVICCLKMAEKEKQTGLICIIWVL